MIEKFNRFRSWWNSEASLTDRFASGTIIVGLAVIAWAIVWLAILLAIHATPLFIFYVGAGLFLWAILRFL